MYVVIWEFRARDEREREFEDAYGPQGDWAVLFAKGAGYLGTELLADAREPGRYLTIDRWESPEASESFGDAYRAAYEELDRRCEELAEDERLLGAFRI